MWGMDLLAGLGHYKGLLITFDGGQVLRSQQMMPIFAGFPDAAEPVEGIEGGIYSAFSCRFHRPSVSADKCPLAGGLSEIGVLPPDRS